MPTFRILQGHWLDQAKRLADNSVHVAVTSPPYWGLRAYKTEPQIWGGDTDCSHDFCDTSWVRRTDDSRGSKQQSHPGSHGRDVPYQSNTCLKCNAWEGELGQEPTPSLFIEHLVAVFREVKRVLRPDGTLWINIGDSYYGDSPRRSRSSETFSATWNPEDSAGNGGTRRSARRLEGVKPTDLVGIPWALAFALRADGWYLRRDNIWHKQSCMPESVMGWRWERCRQKKATGSRERQGDPGTNGGYFPNPTGHISDQNDTEWEPCPGCRKCEKNDGLVLRKGSGRCTTSHEYIFHLSKSENYYYDNEAIAEEQSEAERERRLRELENGHDGNYNLKTLGADHGQLEHSPKGVIRNVRARQLLAVKGTRNKRSVWSLAPEPYSEDHFAAYPSELPVICIKAGTSEHGCCADCGAPYARVVRRKAIVIKRSGRNEKTGMRTGSSGTMEEPAESETLGWRKTCKCETTAMVPPIVLDPFGGRGTTGAAAVRLGRNVILCELQDDYLPMIRKNIKAEAPLFVEEVE
jgi:DNA modification methylase